MCLISSHCGSISPPCLRGKKTGGEIWSFCVWFHCKQLSTILNPLVQKTCISIALSELRTITKLREARSGWGGHYPRWQNWRFWDHVQKWHFCCGLLWLTWFWQFWLITPSFFWRVFSMHCIKLWHSNSISSPKLWNIVPHKITMIGELMQTIHSNINQSQTSMTLLLEIKQS